MQLAELYTVGKEVFQYLANETPHNIGTAVGGGAVGNIAYDSFKTWIPNAFKAGEKSIDAQVANLDVAVNETLQRAGTVGVWGRHFSELSEYGWGRFGADTISMKVAGTIRGQ